MSLEYVGKREVFVFDHGDWRVIVDPDEGTTCECPDHTQWVLDPLTNPRCEHSGLAWRAWLDREGLSIYD